MPRSHRRATAGASRLLAATLGIVLLAAACTQEVERIPEVFRPSNAHEAYRYGLMQANLGDAALARDWIAASEGALREPVEITAPFRETGYFDEAHPTAMGYMLSVARGQRLDAELQIYSREPMHIFMDLFRLVDDDREAPVHVATGAMLIEPAPEATTALVDAPEAFRRLHIEPLRDGVYVLRVQPELLRSARYSVLISLDASLSFPVAGHTSRSVQSVFGAEREAGRRSHHGVDIFAARGTPVLAASAGIVSRANTTPVGGNVVWVNDAKRNMRLYYAHLDTHSVVRGQRVKVGDQLGTVGNTGNAVTTPPHLHFGVYARGPVDPAPFLLRLRTEPEEISVDREQLGRRSRIAVDRADVLASPDRRAVVLESIDRYTPLQIEGASARWFRVTLPDGATGYVAGASTEPATPLRSEPVLDAVEVFDRPLGARQVIEQLDAGMEVPVLGSFGGFLYVQTPSGLNGWLSFE